MTIEKIYCSFNGICKERDFVSLDEALKLLKIDRMALSKLISSNTLTTIFTDKSTKVELESLRKYANTTNKKIGDDF